MAIIYGGRSLQNSYNLQRTAPLDIRTSVQYLSDLANGVIEYPYIGLVTYVQENKQLYIYDGDWQRYSSNGITSVSTFDELDDISESLVADGMLVYVKDEDRYYKYKDSEWQPANIGGGLESVDTSTALSGIKVSTLKPGALAYVVDEDVYYQYKNNQWQQADFNSGIESVDTSANLQTLNQYILSEGMLVYVEDEDAYYKYKDGEWEEANFGGGIESVDTSVSLADIKASVLVDGALAYVKDEDTYYQYKDGEWSYANMGGSMESVDTSASLAGIQEFRLSDGTLAYVQDEDAYYQYKGGEWNQANLGGGLESVDVSTELLNIPESKLAEGALAYVKAQDEYYQYKDGVWAPAVFASAAGIPIYDAKTYAAVKDTLVGDYIYVGNKNEDIYTGEVENNTIQTTNNGNYVDVMFSALRALQSEVAKLRNSFSYGIYSYNGRNTAMSTTLKQYDDVEDDEPLWSIEESDLSEIDDLGEIVLGDGHTFVPSGNVNTAIDGRLLMTAPASWEDTADVMLGIDDAKELSFMTTDLIDIQAGLVNIDTPKINGKDTIAGVDDDGNPTTTIVDVSVYNYTWLDFNDLSAYISDTSAYNIEICLSRKQKTADASGDIPAQYAGKNYVWVSISNYTTGNTVLEGYMNSQMNAVSDEVQELDTRLGFHKFQFGTNLALTKFNFYSKWQDFSHEVVPSKPDDTGYAFKAAHITIRSCETYSILNDISTQLPENELVFIEDTKRLWIKNNDKLYLIGSNASADTSTDTSAGGDTSTDTSTGGDTEPETMDKETLIATLKELGIIYVDASTGLELNPVNDIVWIHQGSGKKFKYEPDSDGELRGTEYIDASSARSTIYRYTQAAAHNAFKSGSDDSSLAAFHGFVGQLGAYEYGVENAPLTMSDTVDHKLYADRVKIAAWYAPLETDTLYGCSHGYIELENSSDRDFDLNGCYLHWCSISSASDATTVNNKTYHLALTGMLKGGSTYLIRCAKYAESTDPNTYISVDTYDQEWWITENGEQKLLDLTVEYQRAGDNSICVKSATDSTKLWKNYGLCITYGIPELAYNKVLVGANADSATNSKSPWLLSSYFVDGVEYGNAGKIGAWAGAQYAVASNSISKNTFELDPAKQAFTSTSMLESSRAEWQKEATDHQQVSLANDCISFPHSDETFPVSNYTPKASFEEKNVITDKIGIDESAPNMVTVSFGKNVYTTRCFNWVSVGYFNEYIWFKQDDGTWKQIAQSYTKLSANATQSTTYPRRHEFTDTTNYKGYEINNIIYQRITGKRFPGSNQPYTVHKCIIDVLSDAQASALTEPVTYTYIVGRADRTGKAPDEDHVSAEQTFTIYPKTYIPQVYQTTDQQGFHWIEYQVWAAASVAINDKIEFDKKYVLDTIAVSASNVKNSATVGLPTYTLASTYDTTAIPNFYKFCSISSNRAKAIVLLATYTAYTKIKLASTEVADGTAVYKYDDTNKKYVAGTYSATDGVQYYQPGEASVYYDITVSSQPTTAIKNTGTEAAPVYAWSTAPADMVTGSTTTFTEYNTLVPTEYTLTLTGYTLDADGGEVAGTNTLTVKIAAADYNSTNHATGAYVSVSGEEGSYTYAYGKTLAEGNYKITNVSTKYTYTWEDQDDLTYTMSYYRTRNSNEQIMPILVNTGDMTQNGTRINEWHDYYTGGKYLFDHMEQMNVVGNNDLCNTDVEALGTGDDEGKSNSYFYSLFYCYEVPTMVTVGENSYDVTPICNGVFIPSLYYFDTVDKRFMMVNSEITPINCKYWFGKQSEDGDPVNIYTGWSVPSSGHTATYYGDFTSIYTMLYHIFENSEDTQKQTVAFCHEMPFTVITNACINMTNVKKPQYKLARSLSDASKLIGSHLNQIDVTDNTATYWFSRLLEYFDVTLCIGGHKHTYAVTWPVRENFRWIEDPTAETLVYKNSQDNYDEYTMDSTLENDKAIFDFSTTTNDALKFEMKGCNYDGKYQVHLTKFPLTIQDEYANGENIVQADGLARFYPAVPVKNLKHTVTYFMCQASGYKLTSNKELPSATQKFGRLIPKTTLDSTGADSPSGEQKYPMISILSFNGRTETMKLARIDGIMKKGKFTQDTYLTTTVSFQWFKEKSTEHYVETSFDPYGHWVKYETPLIVINDDFTGHRHYVKEEDGD